MAFTICCFKTLLRFRMINALGIWVPLSCDLIDDYTLSDPASNSLDIDIKLSDLLAKSIPSHG
jgi:hypothetical protein